MSLISQSNRAITINELILPQLQAQGGQTIGINDQGRVGIVNKNNGGSPGTFTSLTKLITAGSYLAGLGFSIGAIMKFKQHKDNPTQIPIGTPIALVFIAAALLFLPSILSVTGYTMFGSSQGNTAGPTGSTF